MATQHIQIAAGASTQIINTASLSSGAYYIRLVSEDGQIQLKFVKNDKKLYKLFLFANTTMSRGRDIVVFAFLPVFFTGEIHAVIMLVKNTNTGETWAENGLKSLPALRFRTP